MQFNFFGQFTGALCSACNIPFTHGIVRLYQQAVDDAILTHVVAPTKDTLRVLQSDEEKALGAKLLGSGAVDANGNYRLVFDGDKRRYQGGPVLVVLELTHITPMQGPETKHPTISYAVTTLHPRWELSRNQTEALARFDHCFSERLTCAILKHFDIWVISGRVVSCDNPNLPAAGVTVTAMDADLITDDRLGSAVTDSQGRFRISYRSRDFKRNFLPFFNIETLGAAGPDLYFLVTGQGGVELLTETKEDGKRPGRKDVGNCFCVNLCIPVGPPPPPPAMVWTGVGDKFTLSTAGNRNDFDDEGYAEFGTGSSRHKYAIHDITFMTGQKPNPLASGNPIVYRFRIARTTTANNLPALPETAFTEVIRASNGLFTRVQIGTLIRWTPSFRTVKVFLEDVDVDNEGWVDVRRAVQRTLEAHSDFDPADLQDPAQFWQWSDADEMIGLDTTRLTAQGSRPNFATLLPGAPFPDAQYYPIEKIAIRFEIRDQVTRTPLPGNGITLNAMVVNNDRAYAKLGVKNAAGNFVDCNKFNNEPVSIAYTIYHPHIEYAAIKVFDADNRPNPFFDLERQINNTTRPLVVAAADSELELPAIGQTCNYRVTLSWQLLLHNGYAADEVHGISVPFYYEV